MFQKILVPLDGSSLAEQALDPAIALAKQTENSEIILFRVPFYQGINVVHDAYMGVIIPPDIPMQAEAEAKDYLADVQRRLHDTELRIHAKTCVGDEAHAILEIAEEENIDLIVMSTHGRTGIKRWVLGSITERVLQEAPCPVFVIREDQPIQHMLITLDGSLLAESALAPGLTLAKNLGIKTTLLTVAEPNIISAPDVVRLHELDRIEHGISDTILDDMNQRKARYFEALPHRYPVLKNDDVLPHEVAIVSGNPAERILNYVAEHEVDLIVMATHGFTGLQRWIYGSVTTKILRRASCAMLIVRPE